LCTKSGQKGDATIPPEFKVVYKGNGALHGVSVTSSRSALVTDLDKIVFIDNTSGNITYTINTTTFANRKFTVRASIPGANTITIATSAGTIEGSATYGMADNETATFWVFGGNIYKIHSN
jgi:hypothetical protein